MLELLNIMFGLFNKLNKLINVFRVGNQNAIQISDTVNKYIDKTKSFKYEKGEWERDESFLRV